MKGLEALKDLVNTMPFAFLETNSMKYVETIEKELKALEIIKNANLNVVYYGFIDDKDVYALRIGEQEIKYISQEEYDLLKEMLL